MRFSSFSLWHELWPHFFLLLPFIPFSIHSLCGRENGNDSQRASLSGVRKLKMVHYYLFSRPNIHLSDSFCNHLPGDVGWYGRRRRRINAYTIIFRYLISSIFIRSTPSFLRMFVARGANERACVHAYCVRCNFDCNKSLSSSRCNFRCAQYFRTRCLVRTHAHFSTDSWIIIIIVATSHRARTHIHT